MYSAIILIPNKFTMAGSLLTSPKVLTWTNWRKQAICGVSLVAGDDVCGFDGHFPLKELQVAHSTLRALNYSYSLVIVDWHAFACGPKEADAFFLW
jgi:hypothetical protein